MESISCDIKSEAEHTQEVDRSADLFYPCGQGYLVEEEAMAEALMTLNGLSDNEVSKKKKKKVFKKVGRKIHSCLMCDKEYVYKGHLQRHISTQHRLCWPVHQLKCNFCGATFTSEEEFGRHKVATDEAVRKFNEKYDLSETKQQELVSLWMEYVGAENAAKQEVEEEEVVEVKEEVTGQEENVFA